MYVKRDLGEQNRFLVSRVESQTPDHGGKGKSFG